MPAPPPESEPAMVTAIGVMVAAFQSSERTRRSVPSPLVGEGQGGG